MPSKPADLAALNFAVKSPSTLTMPIFKVPIHFSYVFYLATYSRWLARVYFWKAMKLCWLFGVRPSLLLHPLDFMDVEDVPELAFFPAMKLASDKKIALLDHCLNLMEKHWTLGPMQDHAAAALDGRLGERDVPVARFVTSS